MGIGFSSFPPPPRTREEFVQRKAALPHATWCAFSSRVLGRGGEWAGVVWHHGTGAAPPLDLTLSPFRPQPTPTRPPQTPEPDADPDPDPNPEPDPNPNPAFDEDAALE